MDSQNLLLVIQGAQLCFFDTMFHLDRYIFVICIFGVKIVRALRLEVSEVHIPDLKIVDRFLQLRTNHAYITHCSSFCTSSTYNSVSVSLGAFVGLSITAFHQVPDPLSLTGTSSV